MNLWEHRVIFRRDASLHVWIKTCLVAGACVLACVSVCASMCAGFNAASL